MNVIAVVVANHFEYRTPTLGPVLVTEGVPGCWAVVSRSRAQTLLK
jgi:hypothetical protein